MAEISLRSAPSQLCDTPTRKPIIRHHHYDVAGTMDRLRSGMVGEPDALLMEVETVEQAAEAADSTAPAASAGPFSSSTSNGSHGSHRSRSDHVWIQKLHGAAGQIPAILLIAMFHMMIGIPFGVSYFPVGWRQQPMGSDGSFNDSTATDGTTDWVHGPFPIPGKEALGIRMFLFSTAVGQVVFTAASNLNNPIGLQMVENVPFCHALSATVIGKMGYGTDALSTLFVLFGVASIFVGTVFYLLGRLQLGRIVYFFPTHVLVGCIGGIGVFIAKTGLEVTIDATLTLSTAWNYRTLLLPVAVFEFGLRVLEQATKDTAGRPRYSLLSPVYFCMITPVFYITRYIWTGSAASTAASAGYFFPSLDDSNSPDDVNYNASSSLFVSFLHDEHLWDMWTVIDFSVVSWRTIFVDCMPTLVALTLFSLIHVPINLPAVAISTKTDVDMNHELMAHGYSNLIAGALGGLQNYLAYTQTVLYHKSGGRGKLSGLAVTAVTALLFVIGPKIASYIPRCMAGTLLLHVGTDLFLEGVYDSYGKFDRLEYGGIWLIVVVMTLYGMDAAMIAGAIAAVSTYAVQSITYLNPVRGVMSAATLRSSHRARDPMALAILNEKRTRIFVIQLQGHLFFGNMAQLNDSINAIMKNEQPLIVIVDFSLVVSIDSTAARAISKIRSTMQDKFRVHLSIFVTGSEEGFPCESNLSEQLSAVANRTSAKALPSPSTDYDCERPDHEGTHLLHRTQGSVFAASCVCDHLDEALIYAENTIIALENPSLLENEYSKRGTPFANEHTSLADEKENAFHYFSMICPQKVERSDFDILFSRLERQVYTNGDILWKQGSKSDCAKLLVRGTLVALLENEAGTSETVSCGNMIGELGLVQGDLRMSSVQCLSSTAVLYSLSRESFDHLVATAPRVARWIDLILIQYLANRVQHVSNRIFETRCLPI